MPKLGYNQEFSESIEYHVHNDAYDLTLKELIKKYNTGLTTENCLNDCLDFNNVGI